LIQFCELLGARADYVLLGDEPWERGQSRAHSPLLADLSKDLARDASLRSGQTIRPESIDIRGTYDRAVDDVIDYHALRTAGVRARQEHWGGEERTIGEAYRAAMAALPSDRVEAVNAVEELQTLARRSADERAAVRRWMPQAAYALAAANKSVTNAGKRRAAATSATSATSTGVKPGV
jgi:hypothetical protein